MFFFFFFTWIVHLNVCGYLVEPVSFTSAAKVEMTVCKALREGPINNNKKNNPGYLPNK